MEVMSDDTMKDYYSGDGFSMDFEDDDIYQEDDDIIFIGPCTCKHKKDNHGGKECDIDGCDCEAHWEEK